MLGFLTWILYAFNIPDWFLRYPSPRVQKGLEKGKMEILAKSRAVTLAVSTPSDLHIPKMTTDCLDLYWFQSPRDRFTWSWRICIADLWLMVEDNPDSKKAYRHATSQQSFKKTCVLLKFGCGFQEYMGMQCKSFQKVVSSRIWIRMFWDFHWAHWQRQNMKKEKEIS